MAVQVILFFFLVLGFVWNTKCTEKIIEADESFLKHCKMTVNHGHDIMNCSHENLTFIPKIDFNIDTLILSFNYLTNVSQETFINISNPAAIFELYIDHNSVKNISENALDSFTNLQFLHLSYNEIYYYNLKLLLGSLSGKANFAGLDMSAISSVELEEKLFSLMRENHIKTLKASNYITKTLDMKIFRRFNRLKILHVTNNHIVEISFYKYEYMHSLYIDNNNLQTLPDFRVNGNESNCFFPRLEVLSVKNNNIQSITSKTFVCLNNLKKLNIDGNIVTILPNNFLSPLLNIQTVEIMLPGTRSLKVEPFAFNSTSLMSLTIQYRFSALYVFQSLNNTFKLLPKLVKLRIDGISMSRLSDQDIISLFSPLHNLKQIHCNYCQLQRDPKYILNLMKHLDKIDLQSNMLSKLSSETFKDNLNLRYLNLRYNQIGHIDNSALPISLLNRLSHLDISKNPFVCDCNLEWFITWTQSNYKLKTIARYPEEYICAIPKGKVKRRLSDVSFTYRECHPWKTWVWIAIIASPCVIAIVVVIIVVKRNWWNIKHYIYLIRKRQNYQIIDGNNFVYDAFVGYENEDAAWVHGRLLPTIEDEVGLKLCIHQRDFKPGVFINDNIVKSMDKSRKIILVLSNAFAQSGWCMFELKIAHSKLIEDEKGLIVILLEKIDGRNMNHSLKCLFETTTYIEWTDDLVGQRLFWDQLKTSLVQ